MTRDPLLPVRLVGGVWTTEDAGSAAVPTTDDTPLCTGARSLPRDPYPPPWVKIVSIPADQPTDATERQPGIMAPMTWPTPAPKTTGSVDCSLSLSSSEAQFWAAITDEQRTVFAAVALDGSGVWALGDTEQEARVFALGRRRSLYDPPPNVDDEWADILALVTLSGTTDSLRALITSMETGDPVAPWCPCDFWDSGEATP